jgi:glycosyltransferase involved in cell wall biosynthesis
MTGQKRELRIAQIAPPWMSVPPSGYGGIEMVVDLLAAGLTARGHEVTLFAPEGSESPAEVVSPLPAAGADSIGDVWFEAYHALKAHARAESFDVVHDHTFLGPALASMNGADALTVHTLHGPWEERARAYYQLLHDQVHLVAISDTQRQGNLDVRYAATIPNGIDLDAYPLADGERDDFLVYIGRANADKAPELAVRLAHLAQRPLKLLVKRDEPEEQRHTEEQVAPLLGPGDDVLEDVGHEEKLDLLRRGRAFVFPIQWEEPFGLVMIEALACGMPVLATPRGAATEIVDDGVTGFLRRDLEGLASAIDQLDRISPHDCRARVERYFAAETMIDRYEELFAALTS